jgi:hypothetical protein
MCRNTEFSKYDVAVMAVKVNRLTFWSLSGEGVGFYGYWTGSFLCLSVF